MELQLKLDKFFLLGIILAYAIYLPLTRVLVADSWAHHILPLAGYILLYVLLSWLKQEGIELDLRGFSLILLLTILAYFVGTYIYVYGRRGGLPGFEFIPVSLVAFKYLPFWPLLPALFAAFIVLYIQEARKPS